MASPMRKSTFPLDGSHLGSMCKLIFENVVFMLLDLVNTPGLALLIFVVPWKKRGYLKVVYVIIRLKISC